MIESMSADVAASYKERFIDLFVDIPSPNVLEGN